MDSGGAGLGNSSRGILLVWICLCPQQDGGLNFWCVCFIYSFILSFTGRKKKKKRLWKHFLTLNFPIPSPTQRDKSDSSKGQQKFTQIGIMGSEAGRGIFGNQLLLSKKYDVLTGQLQVACWFCSQGNIFSSETIRTESSGQEQIFR